MKKTNNLIVLLSISVLFILNISLVSAGILNYITGQALSYISSDEIPYSCSENDGGKNYYHASGLTYSSPNLGIVTLNDDCVGNDLYEQYCIKDINGNYAYETDIYNCPLGCINDKCVEVAVDDGVDDGFDEWDGQRPCPQEITNYCEGNNACTSVKESFRNDGKCVLYGGGVGCTYCPNGCDSLTGKCIIQEPKPECGENRPCPSEVTNYCEGDNACSSVTNSYCNDGRCVSYSGGGGCKECPHGCDSTIGTCIPTKCGDGQIQYPNDYGEYEQCDDGFNNGIDCDPIYGDSCIYCTYDCFVKRVDGPFCGDNILNSNYEECDDGNLNDNDGCSSNCKKEPGCVDSDGGTDLYTYGTLTFPHLDRIEGDYCLEYWGSGVRVESGSVVVEGICNSYGGIFDSYNCPYGCVDGACLPEPKRVYCKESDGGLDTIVQGVASLNTEYRDYCDTPNLVFEYFCNGYITKDDYIIIDNGNQEDIGFRYRGSDKCTADNPVASFDDLQTGSRIQRSINVVNHSVTLKYGGKVFKFKLLNCNYGDSDLKLEAEDVIVANRYDCLNGCLNGACLQEPTCYDSDDGRDFYVKGRIEALNWGTVSDSCFGQDSMFLLEHYCLNGKHDQIEFECPYGCYDGACIPESIIPTLPPFLIAIDDNAPVSDTILAVDVMTALRNKGYPDIPIGGFPVGTAKLFSEIDAQRLDNQVTLVIYKGQTVIIIGANSPADHVIFATKIGLILTEKGIDFSVILSDEVPSSNLLDLFNDKIRCRDTDNGLDYNTEGITYLNDPHADTCRTDYLLEHVCGGLIRKNDEFSVAGDGKDYSFVYKGSDKCSADNPVAKFIDLASLNTIERPINIQDSTFTLKHFGNVYEFKLSGCESKDSTIYLIEERSASGLIQYNNDIVVGKRYYDCPNGCRNGACVTEKCGVNDFEVWNECDGGYRQAYWGCYDGIDQHEGSETSCKSSEVWQEYAKDYCANRCETDLGCTDTDGGKNYYKKGIIQGWNIDHTQRLDNVDGCNNEGLLVEMYCNDDDVVSYEFDIQCKNGCRNGACQKEAPVCDLRDLLDEGDSKVYNHNGVIYRVTLNYVESSNARFIVNDEIINLGVGDKQLLADGAVMRVNNILNEDIANGVRKVEFSISSQQCLEPACDETRCKPYICCDGTNELACPLGWPSECDSCDREICGADIPDPVPCSDSQCSYDGKCLDIGIRVDNQYCSILGDMEYFKGETFNCDNDFECKSNLCIDSQCVSGTLWQKIINWFGNIF